MREACSWDGVWSTFGRDIPGAEYGDHCCGGCCCWRCDIGIGAVRALATGSARWTARCGEAAARTAAAAAALESSSLIDGIIIVGVAVGNPLWLNAPMTTRCWCCCWSSARWNSSADVTAC